VNGREAVAKAVQLKPDLVVLDFAMPQLDGLKTALEIHAVLPKLPIESHSLNNLPRGVSPFQAPHLTQILRRASAAPSQRLAEKLVIVFGMRLSNAAIPNDPLMRQNAKSLAPAHSESSKTSKLLRTSAQS
jgi:hypothetical protein